MKKILPAILTLMVLNQCHSGARSSELLNEIFKNYYQQSLELFPLAATALGDNRFNDTLPNDLDTAYTQKLVRFYSSYHNRLSEIDPSQLNREQHLSYELLRWELEINLEAIQFSDSIALILQGPAVQCNVFPINQFWSLQLTMGQLAGGTSFQPFKTPNDYWNWLKRTRDYLNWLRAAEQQMRRGMQTGYVLPKAIVVKMIPQIESFCQEPIEEHVFYHPIRSLPGEWDSDVRMQITQAYAACIHQEVLPAYVTLLGFLRNEYLPACRESAGIGQLPGGDKMYQFLIKYYTTTRMTADEIFELGEAEVERITGEMNQVKDQMGYAGDLPDFFGYIRSNPALKPFSDPDQVLAYYHNIHQRMEPGLTTLFSKVPKTSFEIRRTESFMEKTASAGYSPGSLDGTRPGIFYVPIPDVRNYTIFTSECLFLHEAIPGHHYQIALQQENKVLPEFQRQIWYNAFGEGWALYCESLGTELGLYTDPYQYFGMLSNEMHRAIRLVVDVGIHHKGWSREEAIAYSLQHEALPEDQVIAEVERYMSGPAQALSYKIGQLKIRELRNRAERQLGDKFDVKAFHALLLESGCLPLVLLEQKVTDWIDEILVN